MSRERKRGPKSRPREAEGKALKAAWSERRKSREPLPSLFDLVQSEAAKLAEGKSDLARQLWLVAVATQNPTLTAAALELAAVGLDGRDWRAKLKRTYDAVPQPYDVAQVLDVLDKPDGVSDLQAAQMTVAKFGGGASFEGQVTRVRDMAARVRKGEIALDDDAAHKAFADAIRGFGGEPPDLP